MTRTEAANILETCSEQDLPMVRKALRRRCARTERKNKAYQKWQRVCRV